jgi:hypothetical protein
VFLVGACIHIFPLLNCTAIVCPNAVILADGGCGNQAGAYGGEYFECRPSKHPQSPGSPGSGLTASPVSPRHPAGMARSLTLPWYPTLPVLNDSEQYLKLILKSRHITFGAHSPQLLVEAGHFVRLGWRIPMKATILAAFTVLSLGIGFAHAQSAPAGYHPTHYGRYSFSAH